MDKTLASRFKGRGRYAVIAAVALIGILMLSFSGGGDDEEIEKDALAEYREQMEKEISELCESVDGVGGCRVFITFARGETNTYKGSAVIETKPPLVMGVSIVCEGGDSERVKSELVRMICAVFDIGANRVAVMKLNS